MDLASAISLLHAAYLAWFVYTPFSGNLALLAMHVVIAPAMMLHWIMNDDTCVLTAIEAAVRGVDPGETFIGRLVSPIYLVPSGSRHSLLWYAAATALWLRSVWAIHRLVRPAGARQRASCSSSSSSSSLSSSSAACDTCQRQ